MTKKSTAQRIDEVLLELATDLHPYRLISDATFQKITKRILGDTPNPMTEPLTGADIRALRLKAYLSQAVFARYLNLTVGYVSRLERGGQKPSGPALVLLNVIERKGIGAIQ